ncbi:MAG: hypothetical protein LBI42_10480 [Chitinispirillales bacterium]|nr:hypothetical protein [Chitinispirillales bacterium]
MIGSFGRKNPSYHSDVDISIIKSDKFEENVFFNEIYKIFSQEIKQILWIELRKKYVVYFNENPKLEFNVYNNITDIDKYFLGSEILEFDDCVLLDRRNIIESHLLNIIKNKQREDIDIPNLYLQTINKFIYDFESFSNFHKRSDVYKAYFQYNLALNDCLQLLKLNSRNEDGITRISVRFANDDL